MNPSRGSAKYRRKGENLAVLLILYDTQDQEKCVRDLAEAIKEYDEFLAVSDVCYLIHSSCSAEDIFNDLKKKLGLKSADSLLVLTVPHPYKGRAPEKVRNWFERLRENRLHTSAVVAPSVTLDDASRENSADAADQD